MDLFEPPAKRFSREQFLAECGQKLHDTVTELELVELRASAACLEALPLVPVPGRPTIWGLLLFGECGLYFYYAPDENAFSLMVRQAAHQKLPPEQIVPLHTLHSLLFSRPQKRWFDFLSGERKRMLNASFKDKDGIARNFSFLCTHHAESVLRKIQRRLRPET